MNAGILSDSAGRGTFGWLIVVFVAVTIVFALSLQKIIAKMRRGQMAAEKFLEKKRGGGGGGQMATGEEAAASGWWWARAGGAAVVGGLRRRKKKARTFGDESEEV